MPQRNRWNHSVATLAVCGLAVAFALGAGVTQAAPAHAADIFPYEVHRHTLDNGLTVVAVPYDSPGVVAYYSVVRTGSRQEVEEGHSGFAIFSST